jgi:hypothetical protein
MRQDSPESNANSKGEIRWRREVAREMRITAETGTYPLEPANEPLDDLRLSCVQGAGVLVP